MISLEQINGEISALEEERPTYVIMDKLAALYTVRDHMVLDTKSSAAPAPVSTIPHISDSDFSKIIEGKDQGKVWPIIDELVSTIAVMHPKLYDAVTQKLQQAVS